MDTKLINKTSKRIINLIEKENGTLTDKGIESVKQTVKFYFYEPSALAEVLSTEHDISYQSIYNLLK